MKNIAVILAAGIGSRSRLSIPKQYIKIAGKSVIEHTIIVFHKHTLIDEVWVVIQPQYEDKVANMCVKNGWNKVSKILYGGSERYYSSLAAIDACDEECNLIFHDSVRPLVNSRIIDDVIESLEKYEAIDVAVPVSDTIIRRSGDLIDDIPDRSLLMSGQTPQAFRSSLIKRAYDIALKDKEFKTTDDCGVVRKYIPTQPIHIVDGEDTNTKLTNNVDVFIIDKLFQLQSEKIYFNTPKLDLKGKVAVVFGGSYGIGHSIVEELEAQGCYVKSFSRGENSVDISDSKTVNAALESVYNDKGGIDYVINTAAILKRVALDLMSEEDIDSIINVNYYGMVNVVRGSYKYLRQSHGSLLLFTSSSYTRGRALYSLYSSTKAATVNFTQAVAQEWDSQHVRINCINPERTDTPMRVRNFGHEDKCTLLTAKKVATASVEVVTSNVTGQVFDVKME
ncbi:MAG: bifunctional cytidylyltransferase/SDR family oxidoreductase [Rikenellaceae bacterium]